MFYRKHKRLRKDCSEGPGAVQAQRQECDINEIVRRARGDSVVDPNAAQPLYYGDFTLVNSFEEAADLVDQAQERFMELPAKLRAEFENDPQQFLAFAESAEADDWRKLGVIPPREPAANPEAPEKVEDPSPEPSKGA